MTHAPAVTGSIRRRAGGVLTEGVKALLASFFLVFHSARSAILRLAGRPVPWTLATLMYHTVRPDEMARFTRQMDVLKKRFCLVAADAPGSGAVPGEHYAALTFDDGFESFRSLVVPALRERGIPATVFLATDHLGTRPGWFVDGSKRGADERLMDEAEVRELLVEGLVGIGSHSASHVRLLTSALGPDRVRHELVSSKKSLEALLGRPVTLLALPYGEFDEATLRSAEEAGYRRIFLSTPLGPPGDIRGAIAGRIVASPSEGAFTIWLKAMGGYRYMPFAIALKARFRGLFRRGRGLPPGGRSVL